MPRYEEGDFIKAEFPDEVTGVGEWMWVRVHHFDDEKRLVFGILDSIPLNDYGNKLKRGSEVAISYSQIREHKKFSEFTKQ